MLAFLKRRWVLLSCAVVLWACSFFEVEGINAVTRDGHVSFGIDEGNVVFRRSDGPPGSDDGIHLVSIHGQRTGNMPERGTVFISSGGGTTSHHYTRIPLWLPLSAVLGWIVIRELRWREKRSETASLPT